MSSKNRENNYNMIRFVCAVFVIYGHMFVLLGQAAPVQFANEINALGFKMLMIIGGMMITQSCISDDKFLRYFTKRVFRIFPALIFCTILTTFILGTIFTKLPLKEYVTHSETWHYLMSNIMLNPYFSLPGVFADNPYQYAVNGSLWALPIEFALYIIIYVLVIVGNKMKIRKQLIVGWAILICAARFIVYKWFPAVSFSVWGTNWITALNIFPYFALGSLFAVTNLKKYCNIQVASIILMVASVIKLNDYILVEFLGMFSLAYFVISLGEAKLPAFAKCFQKTDLSYGMYLWGFPVQQALIQLFQVRLGKIISPNCYFVMTMVVVCILAYATWKLVEQPATKAMKKVLQKNE